MIKKIKAKLSEWVYKKFLLQFIEKILSKIPLDHKKTVVGLILFGIGWGIMLVPPEYQPLVAQLREWLQASDPFAVPAETWPGALVMLVGLLHAWLKSQKYAPPKQPKVIDVKKD